VIRVLIASGSALERAAIASAIDADRALELVGGPGTPEDLDEALDEYEPDVVVAVVGPQAGAFERLKATLTNGDEIRKPALVVLSDNREEFEGTTRSEIDALLPLDATPAQIGVAIEAAASGLVVVHPAFLDSLPETQPAPVPAPESPRASLTPREVEVLNLLAQGLGNKEIAARLGISEHTVKFHTGSIFNKLDASGRTEAVTLGIRAGLIML
jgi:two-component system, NarL family, response regulator YdfI